MVDSLMIGTPIVGFCNCFVFCCVRYFVFILVCKYLDEVGGWLLCFICLPGVS